VIDLNPLLDLLRSFNPENPSFPPTLLYNEGWLLRLVLNWCSINQLGESPLSFSAGAKWFSEALLPSRFRARYRGDPLSESRTHADGVIGHLAIGKEGKSDLELTSDATQFVILEAKINSPLSSGIKNAPDYDQAARSVACIVEALRLANRLPVELSRLGFYVLAPEKNIQSGSFEAEMERSSIRSKVERRVTDYGGELDMWYSDWLESSMNHVSIGVLSWEEILERIGDEDRAVADSIKGFYDCCLEFN